MYKFPKLVINLPHSLLCYKKLVSQGPVTSSKELIFSLIVSIQINNIIEIEVNNINNDIFTAPLAW
jgi:hypothetical protein